MKYFMTFFRKRRLFCAFNFLYALQERRYTFSTTAALLFYFIKSAATLIAHAGFHAQNKETLSNTGNCKFMAHAKGTQNNLLVKVIETDLIPLFPTNILNLILFQQILLPMKQVNSTSEHWGYWIFRFTHKTQ